MTRSDDGPFVTGVILGLAAGVALGIFIAPQPGAETRKMLRARAAGIIDLADKTGNELETFYQKIARAMDGLLGFLSFDPMK